MRRCWVVVLVLMEKKKTRVIHVLDDDEALTCTHKYNIHLHKKEFMQEVQLLLHIDVANLYME
ncbi:hypothetical protein HanXRQr2_Chr02g0070961 [Helianthus annuus]|uniref:Uncharacterized protein n=1 Tax=Helianthus annuus TaxID=4232 RepID=A0A9K3JNM6_HELAN|nr:hypothetical protein HanXRQr2_Chr02g0070961 [Helianthus annuus]